MISIRLPGILLGIGLGGFIDGIVLHQILQWHHMLTSHHPADSLHGLQVNTMWDGLFHIFAWLMVVAGLSILYARTGRQLPGRVWASRAVWGWMVVGWGTFNLVEGVVDHHILGIHHVRSGRHQQWWDLGFLALGAALVASGWLLQRTATRSDGEWQPAP